MGYEERNRRIENDKETKEQFERKKENNGIEIEDEKERDERKKESEKRKRE